MSTHAHTTTRPRRAPREDVSVLVSVLLDRAASTPWHELYRAASDSTVGLRHAVRHDVERDSWTCDAETCPGFRRWGHCHHIERAKRLRGVQFHHALRLGWGPQQLRENRAELLARVADGWDTADDLDALDALSLLLGEREGEAA